MSEKPPSDTGDTRDTQQPAAYGPRPAATGGAGRAPGHKEPCRDCRRNVWVGSRDAVREATGPDWGYRLAVRIPDQPARGKIIIAASSHVYCAACLADHDGDLWVVT